MSAPRDPRHTVVQRVHLRGLAVLAFAVALGLGVVLGLGMWDAQHRGVASPREGRAGVVLGLGTWLAQRSGVAAAAEGGGRAEQMPRPRTGLVATNENRGQVLFGRYCDSCHPGGREQKGKDLLGPAFRRDFQTEADVVKLVREGTCVMPAYDRFFLPDGDVAEIAKFVVARAQAAASADPTPPLPPLDGQGILGQKCAACHDTIDLPLNPRDPQVLYVVDVDMARCAGLTAQQTTALRTFLLEQQRR
ncbi:MAG: cytochrome c [Chloroflexi bacterium]|nr:cytochrome c [Chloroflexota bacterium]